MEFQDFIKESLEEASKIALNGFGKVAGRIKPEDNNQVLTETDLKISECLIGKIKEVYPGHNIIDEEAGVINNNSNFTWVVDPIDGTSNFASGVVTYGVMLGLIKDNQPFSGGVSLPSFDELYLAEKGKGAFCNGMPIKVSSEERLLSSLVVYQIDGNAEHPEKTREEVKIMGEIILGIRNLRITNSVYDVMLVANGKFGACLNQPGKIWDSVAQQIIVEEAGGIYTDFWGKPTDYSNHMERADEKFTFCCGAPKLHRELQRIIHSAG
ncbi:MAG: inositol monophosphatase [Parcubacteria group bacterium]